MLKKITPILLAVIAIFTFYSVFETTTSSSIKKEALAGYTITEFNGVDAYAELGDTYILKDEGDYLEFTAKWNDMGSAYNGTLGLFGVGGTLQNTVGWHSATSFGVRDNSGNWLFYTVNGVNQVQLQYHN